MAERTCLLNKRMGNCTKGSNPLLSAYFFHTSGCSVARSSRLLWEQEVAGSNPATPTNEVKHFIRLKNNGCVAQLDRATHF